MICCGLLRRVRRAAGYRLANSGTVEFIAEPDVWLRKGFKMKPLQRVLKRLTDFLDQNMLQLFETERFLSIR